MSGLRWGRAARTTQTRDRRVLGLLSLLVVLSEFTSDYIGEIANESRKLTLHMIIVHQPGCFAPKGLH